MNENLQLAEDLKEEMCKLIANHIDDHEYSIFGNSIDIETQRSKDIQIIEEIRSIAKSKLEELQKYNENIEAQKIFKLVADFDINNVVIYTERITSKKHVILG